MSPGFRDGLANGMPTEPTPEQRQSLIEAGYAVLPGAVDADLWRPALQAINHSLGRGLRPEDVARFRARSFCPELQRERVITDLLDRSAAESLVGAGRLERVSTGQIALSFPDTDAKPSPVHPHLDGLYSPANGVPRDTLLSFTMLVGVLLSDVTGPADGNLVVWPGSHRLYEDYFRRHGARAVLDGMPSVPLPEPIAVTGRRGDVVLCHYQLGHAAGDRQRWECLTDLWREWPGLSAPQGTRTENSRSFVPLRHQPSLFEQ
jgi:phytanoyl-CoA dioxygenase PhyH